MGWGWRGEKVQRGRLGESATRTQQNMGRVVLVAGKQGPSGQARLAILRVD